MYANVIIDVSHAQIDRVFEYRIPDGMRLTPGFRVAVPFGKSDEVDGVVMDVHEQAAFEPEKIKPVLRLLDDFAAITLEQLALARHLAQEYRCTLAAALRFMIPAQLRGGAVREKTQAMVSLAMEGETLQEQIDLLHKKDGTVKYPRQLELIQRLRQEGAVPRSTCNASALKSLMAKGVVACTQEAQYRAPFGQEIEQIVDYELSEEQKAVLQQIHTATNKQFLLHGVTGSGKTEVYIRLMRECLAQGKTAIMLVPEISLTPQTYRFLKQRFSEYIAVFHSGLSAGERYDEWLRVKRGEAKIVLGARSAVFAPLEHIGIIIVDEEHESSYRADNYPQYTAHEIARFRCALHDAILLLGSATPQVETYYETQTGTLQLLRMQQRLFGLQLPRVQVVDMREELKQGNRSVISGALYHAMQRALQENKQIMLFLNRRGFSTFVMCRGCGFTVQCSACDVTMTYHKSEGQLRCHYCGRTQNMPKVCPQCGKPYLKYFGVGTQQVQEQVQSLFPKARLLRMDLDTMKAKDAPLQLFDAFSNREADILIGTQMISKGFDFGNVAVSAVLAADATLNFPDYRSAERTFCQITQVAGRAGRKEAGSVIVQTYQPQHYAVRFAQQHDYEGFVQQELALRRMQKLPPYSKYVRIQFSGDDEARVVASVKDFILRLKNVLLPHKNDIISITAAQSAVRRINNRVRYHILLRVAQKDAAMVEQIMAIFQEAQYEKVMTGIEINPMNMT